MPVLCVPHVHCPAPGAARQQFSPAPWCRDTGWSWTVSRLLLALCVYVIAYLASSRIKEHLSCFWHCGGGAVTNNEAKSTQRPAGTRAGAGGSLRRCSILLHQSRCNCPLSQKERDSAGRVSLSSLQKMSLKLTRDIFYLRPKAGAGVLSDTRALRLRG